MVNTDILKEDISAKTLDSEKSKVTAHIRAEMKELSEDMRDKFAAKYEARVAKIKEKYKTKEEVVIAWSKDSFTKLLTQINEENADKNEVADADKGDDKSEKKLSEAEIDEALNTFEKDMSPKTPEAPAPAEKKPETPTDKEKQKAVEFFAAEAGEEIKTPAKAAGGNWIQKWFNKIVISFKEMLGMDVTDDKAKLEWYTDSVMQQKSGILLSALSPFMGSKWVDTLRDPKESPKTNEESLVKLVEDAGVPIKYVNLCTKYIFTGDSEAYKVISKLPKTTLSVETVQAIRGKYLTMRDPENPGEEVTPREKLNNMFSIDAQEKGNYIERAEAEDLALSLPAEDTNRPAPGTDIPVILPIAPQTPTEEDPGEPGESPEDQTRRHELNEIYKHTNLVLNKEDKVPHKTEEMKKITDVNILVLFNQYKAQMETLGVKFTPTDTPKSITEIKTWFEDNKDRVKDVEKILLEKKKNEKDRDTTENAEMLARLAETSIKIKDLSDIIGATGKKSLKVEEIIKLNAELKTIKSELIDALKIAEDSKNIEMVAKTKVVEAERSSVEEHLKNRELLGVQEVHAKHGADLEDWAENLDNIKNVEWVRLLASSDDKKSVYIEVQNFWEQKEKWVIRLELSGGDGWASFYPWSGGGFLGPQIDHSATIKEKISFINRLENTNIHGFRNLEKDGTWFWTDADVDWLKDTNWADQIKQKIWVNILDK